jgi:glycosyltransferase involved in cell wall biosynthesis
MVDAQKDEAPLIAVSANLAWNLVNFRSGLIADLIAQGFKVHAIAPADPAMEARLKALGCGFTSVSIDASGLSPIRDFGTFLALRRIIAELKPAAWLSWTIKPNVYGSLAAGMAGIAALPNVSGLGTAFIRRNLLTVVAKGLYRLGFRQSPCVFFQNHDDRDEFVAGGIIRSDQARILPGSGIDPNAWSPPPGGRRNPRRFLMLSRVVADKGVREFVEAARLVKAKYPDARFILMGELAVANRTAIPHSEVRSWLAEGSIEHLAAVDDVKPQIAEADFVVLPSYREGLSRVLLEAAAMGRPIVTTNVTGCRDIVSDGKNGFLCEPRNAASLAEALERAARVTDTEWLDMSNAGRERVVADFSQTRVSGLYMRALADAGINAPCGG